MHDIRFIREHPEAFDAGLKKRNLPPIAAELLEIDKRRRAAISESEAAQARRKALSRQIGIAKGKGEPADAKPVYFASREAFEATLDELGYSGSGKPEMDPKPTFSDYIEFLFYVADHGSPELRAEYLRRVKKIPTATTADRSK